MSQIEDSNDQEVSEWIRPSAGGPDTDVAALMSHVQTKVRSEFCSATPTHADSLLWTDARDAARRAANHESHIQYLLGSAAIINGTLLDDPVPQQPRLQRLLDACGGRYLARVATAIVLLALRKVLPLLQAAWKQQISINGLILAENHELLRRLKETEATLQRQDERIAWLIGKVLKPGSNNEQSETFGLKIVSEDSVSRAA